MISSILDFQLKTCQINNILPHSDQFTPAKPVDHHC